VGVVLYSTHSTPQAQAQAQEKPKATDKSDNSKENLSVRESPPKAKGRSEPKYRGKSLAYWIVRFENADSEEEQKEPAKALIAFGVDAAPAFPKLMEMLDDRSREHRAVILNIFDEIGPGAKPIVPDLIKGLKEKTARDPERFVILLGKIGPDAKEAVPFLVELLNNPQLRNVTFYSLCNIGPGATEAIPAIQKIIHQAESDGSFNSLHIGLMHQFGPEIVPVIIEFLKAGNPESRISILQNLNQMESSKKTILPELTKLLKEWDKEPTKNSFLRLEVAETCRKLGRYDNIVQEVVIPVFVDFLKGKEVNLARYAADLLGEMGSSAKSAIPALEHVLLHESDENVRGAAKTAIKRIKGEKE
jgi:hypothetical protein